MESPCPLCRRGDLYENSGLSGRSSYLGSSSGHILGHPSACPSLACPALSCPLCGPSPLPGCEPLLHHRAGSCDASSVLTHLFLHLRVPPGCSIVWSPGCARTGPRRHSSWSPLLPAGNKLGLPKFQFLVWRMIRCHHFHKKCTEMFGSVMVAAQTCYSGQQKWTWTCLKVYWVTLVS